MQVRMFLSCFLWSYDIKARCREDISQIGDMPTQTI